MNGLSDAAIEALFGVPSREHAVARDRFKTALTRAVRSDISSGEPSAVCWSAHTNVPVGFEGPIADLLLLYTKEGLRDILAQKGVHSSGVLTREDMIRKLEQLRLPDLTQRKDPGV